MNHKLIELIQQALEQLKTAGRFSDYESFYIGSHQFTARRRVLYGQDEGWSITPENHPLESAAVEYANKLTARRIEDERRIIERIQRLSASLIPELR